MLVCTNKVGQYGTRFFSMITGSPVKVGAKMERDSLSRSLAMQQNFYEVPQLEKIQDLLKFLDLFLDRKIRIVTVNHPNCPSDKNGTVY
jgi:hypothetical protein